MTKFESLEPFLDRLFRVSESWGARISPDGRRVAWIAGNLGATTQLWQAPTDGSAPPTAWVANDRDCDWFFWAPDSSSIILGQSRDGDERVGLSQISLDGTARDLTEQRPDFYIHGGQIDPSGRYLVYAANRGPASGREIETHVIYRHEIASGERIALARLKRAAYVTPRLSPDGRHVLYHRKDRDPAGRQAWLVGIDGSRDREILSAGDARKVEALWAPDSAQIVVTAEAGDHRRVGLLDSTTDQVLWLIDDPSLQIVGAHWPKGSDRIVLTETKFARDFSSLVDPASGRRAPFPTAEGTLLPIGPAADGSWICYHYDARNPMRLVRQDAGGPKALSDLPGRRIAASDLAAARDFRWRASDGLEIQGWLYEPRGATRGAIILVHGGPTAHSEDAFDPEVQYLVAAGFAVLQPNYRGSTGFGLPFQEAIKEDGWGGREQDDIARGASALIAAGIAAAGQVGVTGTSYGGYSSWWQITATPPDIIKAAAPICGMTDLVVDYETTRPDLRPYSEEMMGGSPAQVPERYRERSPIHFVDRIRGRLLIVQGLNDPNVTPQNVTDVRQRLDAAGVPYELLLFKDEGHGIAKPENCKELCRRLASFFAAAFEIMTDVAQLAHDWARNPVFWEPKLSKDGRWAAWTWTGSTEAGNVWLAPTDGSAPPRRVTDEADHIYVRSFSPDGKRLLLAQSPGSSEHDHLIQHDLESGAQQLLTPKQDDHYVFGGAFTPDGRSILYAASWDDATKSAIEGQRIYLHDIASGERRMMSASDSLSDRPIELSDDGRFVLYHRTERHPAGSQIWLLGLSTGEDREIFSAGDAMKAYGSWIDDGRILVSTETATHDRIGVLALPGLDVRWLIDDPARTVENAIAGATGRHVATLDFRGGALHATELDLASGAERPIAFAGYSLLPIAQLPSGPWLCERYSSRAPHELVQVDPATGAMIEISRSAVQLAGREVRFAPAQLYRWRSTDGTEIAGWLYEPDGSSRGLIAIPHGGPTWHSEDWVNSTIQFLVGVGFTVLDPNYRGSTGYGRAFREAIKEDGWGGREQDDIRTGIESLVAAGKGRRGRIGIIGLSYGGYSSWCQITKSADLVNAAVPICGMYQLATDYDETGMPHGRAYSEEMMGGTPSEQPERYFNASPANFIDRIKGRLMIVHGMQDSNVSPENTRAAIRDLDRAGIPYELLTFDNEGHGIYRAGNRETLFRRVAEFFEDAFANR